MAKFNLVFPKEKIEEVVQKAIEQIKSDNDLVKVVRCRDCCHCRELERSNPWEDCFIEEAMWCAKRGDGVLPDEYCSDGERREENGQSRSE